MKWSESVIHEINDIKKDILFKKVTMNFLITFYSWWDKVFRWGHEGATGLAPVFSLIAIAAGPDSYANVAAIFFGTVSAGMLKLKPYTVASKIHDNCKKQLIRYDQVYQEVSNEEIKGNNERMNGTDFTRIINKEMMQISMSDSELTPEDVVKFQVYCDEQEIKYKGVVEELQIITAQISVVQESKQKLHKMTLDEAHKNEQIEKFKQQRHMMRTANSKQRQDYKVTINKNKTPSEIQKEIDALNNE